MESSKSLVKHRDHCVQQTSRVCSIVHNILDMFTHFTDAQHLNCFWFSVIIDEASTDTSVCDVLANVCLYFSSIYIQEWSCWAVGYPCLAPLPILKVF